MMTVQENKTQEWISAPAKQPMLLSFYSVLKNEDADPFAAPGLLAVADGLGGAGLTKHTLSAKDKVKLSHELRGVILSEYDKSTDKTKALEGYLTALMAPMIDSIDDTSALWASRIAIARFVFAQYLDDKLKDLSSEKVRGKLTEFILEGLNNTRKKYSLETKGMSNQLILPTTFVAIKYEEVQDGVVADVVWAGDSRAYALIPGEVGLKQLSIDDEDGSGAISNLFFCRDKDYGKLKPTKLNYARYKLPAKCILFVASDGVFDPYGTLDNVGVEGAFLAKITECNSMEELKSALKKHFDEIKHDDSTVALAALGFEDYNEVKTAYEYRAAEVIATVDGYFEVKRIIELIDRSPDDINEYVKDRIAQKASEIADILAKLIADGKDDIAITTGIKLTVAAAQTDYEKAQQDATKNWIEGKNNDIRKLLLVDPSKVGTYLIDATPAQNAKSHAGKKQQVDIADPNILVTGYLSKVFQKAAELCAAKQAQDNADSKLLSAKEEIDTAAGVGDAVVANINGTIAARLEAVMDCAVCNINEIEKIYTRGGPIPAEKDTVSLGETVADIYGKVARNFAEIPKLYMLIGYWEKKTEAMQINPKVQFPNYLELAIGVKSAISEYVVAELAFENAQKEQAKAQAAAETAAKDYKAAIDLFLMADDMWVKEPTLCFTEQGLTCFELQNAEIIPDKSHPDILREHIENALKDATVVSGIVAKLSEKHDQNSAIYTFFNTARITTFKEYHAANDKDKKEKIISIRDKIAELGSLYLDVRSFKVGEKAGE